MFVLQGSIHADDNVGLLTESTIVHNFDWYL